MRTLPLFSSVAHTPIGELALCTGAAATGAGAGAGAAATGAGAGTAATGAGAGAASVVMALATGGGGATRLLAGAAGAAATGATGAAATGAGAGATVWAGAVVVFAGGGSDTSSSLSLEPKPLRSILPSLPLKPGASIWMQLSELQPRGDSIRTRLPSIWKVTAPPAWAAVVAKSSAVAAAKASLFM